jgi:hypothetical protein
MLAPFSVRTMRRIGWRIAIAPGEAAIHSRPNSAVARARH